MAHTMTKISKGKALVTVALLATMSVTIGCESDAATGGIIGAGAGAGIGAIVGHNSGDHAGEGAAFGAAAGGLGGYIIGNESDKSKIRARQSGYEY